MRAIVQRAHADPRAGLGLVVRRGRQPRARPSRSLGGNPAPLPLASVTKSGRGAVLAAIVRPPLPSPRCPSPPGPARRARRAQRRSAHRLRRFAGLTAVAAVGVVTLLVTAFGPDGAESARSLRAGARPTGCSRRAAAAARRRDPGRSFACSSRSSRTASPRSATTEPASGSLALRPARATRQPGPDRTALRPRLRLRRLEHDLVPAPGRHRFVDVGARGRRGAGHRRLLAGRRNDRGDHRLRPQRRERTACESTSDQLAAPALIVSISRLEADPALTVGSSVVGGEKPARRSARPLAVERHGARALHAGRREPRDRPGPSGRDARTQLKTSLRRGRVRRRGPRGRSRSGCRGSARSWTSTSAS